MLNLIKRLNIGSRISRRKKNRSVRLAHQQHRKNSAKEYAGIDEIIQRFRSGGGLKHEFQCYKLWELQKYLNDYNPQSILELGSGSSTAVFAKHSALAGSSVTSYDESAFWIENTKRLLGDQFHDRMLINQADRILGFDGEVTTVNYDVALEGSFDFVMVDGPSQRINDIRRKDSVNADVLGLLQLPKIILVDARESTFKYLAEKLEGKYQAFPSDLITKDRVSDGYNYFSRLVRV